MKTFSAYWHPELERAIKKVVSRRKKPFTMSLVGEDILAVENAVNQGIDSHLEACFVPDRGDSFKRGERFFIAQEDTKYWKKGDRVVHTLTLECVVSNESLPVLIRRLFDSDDEHAESLAHSICDGLNIELV